MRIENFVLLITAVMLLAVSGLVVIILTDYPSKPAIILALVMAVVLAVAGIILVINSNFTPLDYSKSKTFGDDYKKFLMRLKLIGMMYIITAIIITAFAFVKYSRINSDVVIFFV